MVKLITKDGHAIYDVVIVGGGINGTAIAVDVAGRGMSVLLCEQGDLASGTSSASSKLIHGGLRYLEHYEFHLVRRALFEREVLLQKAPHLITPMRFVLPHSTSARPFWMLRLGLWLYDHIAKRTRLADTQVINCRQQIYGETLLSHYKKALIYSDCWVDDARLVLANAMHARENGAIISPRTRFTQAQREKNFWKIELYDSELEQTVHIFSRCLVNAAGPWLSEVGTNIMDSEVHQLRLVKGSHIIINKFYSGDHAYTIQTHDKRIVFVIPFLQRYLIIGTTEIIYEGQPDKVSIDLEEQDYLIKTINENFNVNINNNDVVSHYSGVRPLLIDNQNDLSANTRDYKVVVEDNNSNAPLVTILGGKLTTHRKLAEAVCERLQQYFPEMTAAWTADVPLPGGDLEMNVTDFADCLRQQYPWLSDELSQRYAHSYGTLSYEILADVKGEEDMGKCLFADLYEAEVNYLMAEEWAKTAEDILWRRTKLGVIANEEDVQCLDDYCHGINVTTRES